MRDIGYSLETAISDIIDNSISAGARKIRIIADPSTDSLRLAIVDDGSGMSESELLEAMRPGSKNALCPREGLDLGRFGLGLKTASFSQCRRLTVVSAKSSRRCAATWDLDHVATTDRWEVELPADIDSIPHASELSVDGTLVLWERIDRILGDAAGDRAHELLARRLSETAAHLELIFHRFLSGEPGQPKIVVELNGNSLKPSDPFGLRYPATQQGPEEICLVKDQPVRLQTFTLPHHSKLPAKEYENLAGPAGYLRNQGFYVYRERRLIIWGTWFGLARQRPITQLTRVRIDTPRELDSDWKIDVKKASAQPPAALRERLCGLVERICAGSKRVYTHKGTRIGPDERLGAWSRVQDKGTIRYRVNLAHPIVEAINSELSEQGRGRLRALISLVEAELPIDAIFADVGGEPKTVKATAIESESLHILALETYQILNHGSKEWSAVVLKMMEAVEPFQSSWTSVDTFLRETFSWR